MRLYIIILFFSIFIIFMVKIYINNFNNFEFLLTQYKYKMN